MRQRIRKLIAQKAKGQEIEVPGERRAPAEIVDLMTALKASLEARGAKDATPKKKAGRSTPRRQVRKAS